MKQMSNRIMIPQILFFIFFLALIIAAPGKATAKSGNEILHLSAGESLTVDNGDGTRTHFVLDPAISAEKAVNLDIDAYLAIYNEVKHIMEQQYECCIIEEQRDIIFLLNWKWAVCRDFYKEAFMIAKDGVQKSILEFSVEEALTYVPNLFKPEDYKVTAPRKGFYHARDNSHNEFAIITLTIQSFPWSSSSLSYIASHELAHSFTNMAKAGSADAAEEIAEYVTEIMGAKAGSLRAIEYDIFIISS